MIEQERGGRSPSLRRCSCCGDVYELEIFDPRAEISKKMEKEKICFSCAFWKEKIDAPLPNREVIDGVHYVFDGWLESKHYFQGSGGRKTYILTNDGVPKRSNNVWCQGIIPDIFREQLPDTAVFITKKLYSQISQNPSYLCQAKGCWDRHHCYWFDKKLAEKGEWNEIPSDHVLGEEFCENFINKKDIYG